MTSLFLVYEQMSPQLVIGKPLLPSHSQLVSDEEQQHYWTALMKDWNVRWKTPSFPGCNPRSISRETLPLLKEHDYSITLKSDGVRYVLYCTTRPGSTTKEPLPVALMIDRSRNMYEVDVIAQEDVFLKRTILEGELVWRQPQEKDLVFLVFDCVLVRGESFLSQPFSKRLEEVHRCTRLSDELSRLPDVEQLVADTDNIVMMQFQPSVIMRPKTFVEIDNAQRLWDGREGVEHRVDGIILQRNDSTYTLGTASAGESFKWKEKSTVDLTGPDAQAADGRLPESYFGRRVFLSPDSKIQAESAEDVIEYLITVTDTAVVLFGLRRRVDKDRANGLKVVKATIKDVMDQIRPDELGGLRC